MDLGGIRRLYLPLRPKARFSPGRKTPPGVSAPSTGLRPLNVSRVKCGADLVAATTCFRQADIKSSTIFYKRRIEGISYFLYMVALSGLDKVRPPHLTRETISGRRPADGADTLG